MITAARRASFSGAGLRGLAAALVAALAPLTASAQDTSGKADLLAAVEAAQDLTSLTADVKLSGAGGFADWVPTGEGEIRLAKDAEADPAQGAWHTRVDTTYIHKKGEEQQDIVILRSPEQIVWIDHEKKVVQERGLRDRSSQFRSIPELFGLGELTSPEPYARELREATSWQDLGTETVNGVECDVVLVRYDMTKGKGPRDGSMTRTPATKWFFSTDDHLPRRVERITDTGGISFTIVQDVNNVRVNPGIKPASLAIETPEGYTRSIRNTGRSEEPASRNVTEIQKQQADLKEAERRAAADLTAHGFELKDGDGNDVSLDSLKGSVAVLYFWGTWCVPCKEWSPLVSDLVDTFAGEPVKVFGLPVRERSEDAVREAMSGYNHTLLLNPDGSPIGCDETARAYKVRRYPTVYVIGMESEIIAVRMPTAEESADDIMAEVQEEIRDYLDTRN